MVLFILIFYFFFILFFVKNKKVFFIGFLIFIIFYFYSYKTCERYENFKFQNFNNLVKVVSSKEEKQHKDKYIVKFKNYKFILYCDKNKEFEYGDLLKVDGTLSKSASAMNFGGFDYSRYLRQNKIYGILEVDNLIKVGQEKDFFSYLEKLKFKLKLNLKEIFNEEQAGFLIGLVLGDKSEILDDTEEIFRDSSLSHILALSGMHVIYVSFAVKFILDFIIQNQRLKNFLMILFLIFFSVFTGGSPSCVRACIMSSIVLLSKIVYRKSDFLTNLLIALDILLIINPYNIESIGMWLSFLATFGLRYNSCNLMIIPVIWNCYHKLSLTFFISNFFASFLIGPIIILGYIHLFLGKFIFPWLESGFIDILFYIAKLIGSLKFSKLLVPKVPVVIWIFYYIIVFGIFYFRKNIEVFKKFISFIKSKIKFIFYIIGIIALFFAFVFIKDENLEIHFLDVGQGDSCLIVTPRKKTILIDGGNNEGFDNGENVVSPYLLNNMITKIDYLIVSHGDSDHIGGLFYILENFNVNNVVIPIQKEEYSNIQKLLDLINDKKINLIAVSSRR